MSQSSDYLKKSDAEFALQLTNFSNKIESLAPTLGISAAQVTSVKADAVAFNFAYAGQQTTKDFAKSWTSFKSNLRQESNNDTQGVPALNLPAAPPLVANGIEPRFRALVAQVKTSPNYTEAIGQQLGIIASETSAAKIIDAQPRILGLLVSGGSVLLKWQKGVYDGINIYKKVGNGAYQQVGVDTKPDWNDKKALPANPEIWTYKIIYFIDDEEVGLFSDEASINVGG